MPSTIYNGALLALMEPTPLIRMVEPPDAGSPEDDITCTPGVVPANALVTLVATRDSIVSESTMDAEPVNELLVVVP